MQAIPGKIRPQNYAEKTRNPQHSSKLFIQEEATKDVELRSSPRFTAAENVINQMMTDTPTQRAVSRLAQLTPQTTPQRKSPRIEGLEVVMDGEELDRLRRDRKRARTTFQQIAQVRKSPRLNN